MMRKFLAALLATVGLMASAHAGVQITFNALNVTYDGASLNLSDAGGLPSGADAVIQLTFLDTITSAEIGTLPTAEVDFHITLNGPLAAPFGDALGTASFFTITSGAYSLVLGASDVRVFVNPANVASINVTNPLIISQTLPFGISLDDPVSFNLSASLQTSATSGGNYSSFTALGNGNVVAAQVPEPAVLGLLGIGLLAMGLRRGRNKRQA